MDYVIRRRTKGITRKGVLKPLKLDSNGGLSMLEEERIEHLSPASAVFHKPDFNIHVLAIFGTKTPVDIKHLKANFQTSLCKHPRFSSIVVANVISERVNAHTTIAFSNLAGPLEDISFYGLPLTLLAPTSYGQPNPLMINFQSYSNKMTVVLAVDEDVIPDPHQMCDDIVDSLKLVKDAVIAKGLAKEFAVPNGCPTAKQ